MSNYFNLITQDPKKVSYLNLLMCRTYLDYPLFLCDFTINLTEKVFNQKNQVLKYNNNYNNNPNFNLFYEGEKELFSLM